MKADVGTSSVTLTKRRITLSRVVMDALDKDSHLSAERVAHLFGTRLTQWRDFFANPLAVVEVRTPETWWEALKQALKNRWPRVFGRLRPRMRLIRVSVDDVYPQVLPPVPALGEPLRMVEFSQRRMWEDDEPGGAA